MKFTDTENSIFGFIADYLTYSPRAITEKLIHDVTNGDESSVKFAYPLLLASLYGLDSSDKEDKAVIGNYFLPMVKQKDTSVYTEDPFYKLLTRMLDDGGLKNGKWSIGLETYAPYELFVASDPKIDFAGRIIPTLGYFSEAFSFPVIYESGREWMSLKPNEIETMRKPLSRAKGNVLVGGLGIGYFVSACARNPLVTSITVVERDDEVIKLIVDNILPFVNDSRKIKIVKDDAVAYAREHLKEFDYSFMDLWHDPTDGVDLYLELKSLEPSAPNTVTDYWIEDTLKLYLPD